MTISDALVVYKTFARAEGKSPKTVTWVTSSVGYKTRRGCQTVKIASLEDKTRLMAQIVQELSPLSR